MLYRNNRPNRDMCKRFFDDNLKTYALRALKVSWVPTNSTIEVTFKPQIGVCATFRSCDRRLRYAKKGVAASTNCST